MPGGTNNNEDLTTFELTLLGKDALFFFELRAINTTPDPDLPGPAFCGRGQPLEHPRHVA